MFAQNFCARIPFLRPRPALPRHSEACVGRPKNLSVSALRSPSNARRTGIHRSPALASERILLGQAGAVRDLILPSLCDNASGFNTVGRPWFLHKPIGINTYVKSSFNPSVINTYKNTRLKVEQNQHLQKSRGVGSH